MTDARFPTLTLKDPWEASGIERGSPMLLALSGGADSVALLHSLLVLQQKHPFTLTLAHVNHGIRGADALRDRDFCVQLAAQHGLEICVLNADVPSVARERGCGLEEAARDVRYAYFEKLMCERQIPILLTAHHADDQLETVLFRLSRGCSVRGLGGMTVARPFGNGTLVRPMLQLSRDEILAFCRENGFAFVTDQTNFDPSYTRNRLRAEVLPILTEMFPQIRRHVQALTGDLREDDAYLSAQAEAFCAAHADGNRLRVESLCDLPRPIQTRVLLQFCRPVCGEIERVHVEALLPLLKNRASKARVALPNGFYATRRGEMLVLTRERRAKAPATYTLPFSIGDSTIPGTDVRISVRKTEKNGNVHNLSTPSYINLTVGFDIITKDAHWRPCRPGEKLLLGGMHRPLRKCYAARGFSPEVRAKMPLLCDGEGVLWAPGVGLRDGVDRDGATDGYLLEIFLEQDGETPSGDR